MKWQKDVQGLRAVALWLVLFYHTDTPGFSGGFVGVDMFFVVSGYLITTLLEEDLSNERSNVADNMKKFYARRIRRLLPSATLTIVLTLFLGVVVLGAGPLRDLVADARAAALFSANIHFYLSNLDYSNAGKAPSMLLHYWSLAVEEQFYFVWPMLMVALVKLRRVSTHMLSTAVVVAAWAVSLFAAHVYVQTQPTLAFFLLPTRAWELLTGCLLAITLHGTPAPASPATTAVPTDTTCVDVNADSSQAPLLASAHADSVSAAKVQDNVDAAQRKTALDGTAAAPEGDGASRGGRDDTVVLTLLAYAGAATVAACTAMYGPQTRFPGIAAIWPVLATVGLLLAPRGSLVSRALSADALQWVGDASYSIYLLHWPAICTVRYVLDNAATGGGSVSWLERLLLSWAAVLASIAAAAVMYAKMEMPVRNLPCLKTLRSCLVLMVVLVLTSLAVGSIVPSITPPASTSAVASHVGGAQVVTFAAGTDVSLLGNASNTMIVLNFSADATEQTLLARLAAMDAQYEAVSSVSAAVRHDMHIYQKHQAMLLYYSTVHRALPPVLEPPLSERVGYKGAGPNNEPNQMRGDPKGTKLVVVLGDSHGQTIAPAMNYACKALGYRLFVDFWVPCGMFQDASKQTDGCRKGEQNVFDRIAKLKPHFIVVHFSFGYGTPVVASGAVAFYKAINAIASVRAILLTDINRLPFNDVVDCLTRHNSDVLACAPPPVVRKDASFSTPARDAGVSVVHSIDLFCIGGRCPIVMNQSLVMYDCNHMTSKYSHKMGALILGKLRSVLTE